MSLTPFASRHVALLAVLPLALLLSGCFQIFSTLTVRPDGSAQIVERITAEGAMAMGLMAMSEMPGDGPTSFESRAASLGEGVTLASVDEEIAPGQITYVVTYDVADVNLLSYTVSDAVDPESVGESVMGGGMGMDDGMDNIDMESGDEEMGDNSGFEADMDIEVEEDEDLPYRFAFTPASGGQPATLRVTVPDGAGGPGDFDLSEMGGGETEEDSYKQALVLLGTMAMRFDVVVEGALVDADRGWAEGSRVTLSSIQMGSLLEYARDEIENGDVQAFIARQDSTADLDLPGLRTVAPGTVTVRFQ